MSYNTVQNLIHLLSPEDTSAGYASLSLFYLFSESEEAKNIAILNGVLPNLVTLISSPDVPTAVKENALRSIGALSKKTEGCDYRNDVILAGTINALRPLFALSFSALRVYSVMTISVLLENPSPDGLIEALKSEKSVFEIIVAENKELERDCAKQVLDAIVSTM